MLGRVCLVTGANSGLGFATSTGLARLGATVIMLCRNIDRGTAARDHVRSETGSAHVSLVVADLASLDEVRRAAAEVASAHAQLHVLVNNAGIQARRRRVTQDGFEETLAVNHLAPFLLTSLLAPLLRASAPARVITVASQVERMGRIRFDDLQLEDGYGPVRAYAQSKLANILFTYELASRLAGTGVTANCLHPGYLNTGLMRESPDWMRALWRPFLPNAERGARTVLYLATAPELDSVTGGYFERCRPARSSRRSYDVAARRRVWDLSAALTSAPPING
ncbi:MAG TPA: SDR family oxidoreductase [Gemmatimonadaceae bacterium]